MKKQKYGRKEYMKNKNIHNTREWFRTRFGSLPGIIHMTQDFKSQTGYVDAKWPEKRKDILFPDSVTVMGT